MRAASVQPAGARARGARLALAALAALGGAGLLAGACMETRRSLGEDCLKDSDCLSGVCAQLLCAAAPTTTDTRATVDAGPGAAAGDGAGADATDGSDGEGDATGDVRSEQEDVLQTSDSAAADGTIDGDGSGD